MREEFVCDKVNFKKFFEQVATSELWIEIARRFNVKFGKIQVAIHEGRPSKFANIDIRVNTAPDLEAQTK